MSSTPPYTPPGGGAPPPYDPRTQWRVYREQQRAAWRAQRDAMRAQRHAWKARATAYGPRVPSVVGPLILVGRRHRGAADRHRAHRLGRILGLVRALVAAAADRRRRGHAGRVGAGHEAADAGAPRRQLRGDSDRAGGGGIVCRLEPRVVGSDAGRVGRPGRRLLQHVRTAAARHGSAGAEHADPGQRHHRNPEPARGREHHRRRQRHHAGAGARGGLCRFRHAKPTRSSLQKRRT